MLFKSIRWSVLNAMLQSDLQCRSALITLLSYVQQDVCTDRENHRIYCSVVHSCCMILHIHTTYVALSRIMNLMPTRSRAPPRELLVVGSSTWATFLAAPNNFTDTLNVLVKAQIPQTPTSPEELRLHPISNL